MGCLSLYLVSSFFFWVWSCVFGYQGDCVLDGSSTLTLQVSHLQHLTRLFEQHLISRTHQHGFLALPSHPADTASLLQVQFLFDVLQKTLSMKVHTLFKAHVHLQNRMQSRLIFKMPLFFITSKICFRILNSVFFCGSSFIEVAVVKRPFSEKLQNSYIINWSRCNTQTNH